MLLNRIYFKVGISATKKKKTICRVFMDGLTIYNHADQSRKQLLKGDINAPMFNFRTQSLAPLNTVKGIPTIHRSG